MVRRNHPPAAGGARERPYSSEVSVGRVGAPVRHVQGKTGEVRWLGSICKAGGCSRHSYFTNQISVRTQSLLSEICAAAPRLCTSPPAHTDPSLRDLRHSPHISARLRRALQSTKVNRRSSKLDADLLLCFAERRRFELLIPFRGIHAFQACLLSHSSISP